MNCSLQNSNRKMEYNETTAPVYLAVDVSKKYLETFHASLGANEILNEPATVLRWLKKLRKQFPQLVVICEASGGYENSLLACCWEIQCPVVRLNPRFVRHFAKSKGILSKTDRMDSQLILRFAQQAEAQELPRLLPPPQWRCELKSLLQRRSSITEMIQMEQNRLEKNPTTKTVERSHQDVIGFLETQRSQIDEALQKIQDQVPELEALTERLRQIPSIGQQTAQVIIAYMPELGSLTGKQAAALAGVAPFSNESGTFMGKRRIAHGRAHLRRALYMSAVVCIRHNPILGAYYQHLKANGKPSKVALVAVMRKLIILCNRMIQDPEFQLA